MKRQTLLIAGLLLIFFAAQIPMAGQEQPAIAKTNLKVGDTAPDFSLLDNEWKTVKLSDFRGKKNVILAFYVLAFTGG